MPALRMGDVEEQRAADRDRDRRTVEIISGARKLVPDQLLEIVARLLDVVAEISMVMQTSFLPFGSVPMMR
jgi:hypothetical protein